MGGARWSHHRWLSLGPKGTPVPFWRHFGAGKQTGRSLVRRAAPESQPLDRKLMNLVSEIYKLLSSAIRMNGLPGFRQPLTQLPTIRGGTARGRLGAISARANRSRKTAKAPAQSRAATSNAPGSAWISAASLTGTAANIAA